MDKYNEYKVAIQNDVQSLIAQLGCQPVIFAGAGLSRRYYSAPDWKGLLRHLAEQCPLIEKEFAYYVQSCTSDPQIGSQFTTFYREWAWGSGRNKFDPELFKPDVPGSAYIKAAIAQYFDQLCPTSDAEIGSHFAPEISALREIRPHSVITTNYDRLLEAIFPDHTPVIGQDALQGLPFAIGEIFKIHGCTSAPNSLVFNSEDYAEFIKKKKFISAKLLTLFNEHPLLICGYSASDPNICAILSDIDEALALPGTLVPNIYFVEYDNDAASRSDWPSERLIQISENRSVRVKCIVADGLEWVFDAFKSPETLGGLTPRLMRAILSRSFELVRTDIPRKTLKVNFEFLERKLDSQDEFAELFGITTVSLSSQHAALYPHTITELGKKLGGKGWHRANDLIKMVEDATGFQMKNSDNKYHQKVRIGKTEFGKYSDAALDLLSKVRTAGLCHPDWVDIPEPNPGLFGD